MKDRCIMYKFTIHEKDPSQYIQMEPVEDGMDIE